MIPDHRAGATSVTGWGVGLLATAGLAPASFVGEIVGRGGVAEVSEIGLSVCWGGAVSLTSARHAVRSMSRKTANNRPLLREMLQNTSKYLVAVSNIG